MTVFFSHVILGLSLWSYTGANGQSGVMMFGRKILDSEKQTESFPYIPNTIYKNITHTNEAWTYLSRRSLKIVVPLLNSVNCASHDAERFLVLL